MTDLEDRLRRDLTTYAGRATAENIRGLQPPTDPHSARRARQSRARRWLAPTGAAVAVAGDDALAATAPRGRP